MNASKFDTSVHRSPIIIPPFSATKASSEILKTSRDQTKQASDILQEKYNKTAAHLTLVQSELKRAKHQQEIAKQINEWKTMIEQSNKMADQMKALVHVIEDEHQNE